MSAAVVTTAGLARLVAAQAEQAGRDDLASRAVRAAARLEAPKHQVLVMGAFKSGKSSLVNALLGADICPVDDDIATVLPCVIGHGDRTQAVLVLDEPEPAGTRRTRRHVALADAQRAVVSAPLGAQWVEVQVPRRLLSRGVTVVDTPGIGGLTGPASLLALRAAGASTVAVVVADATQELTATELRFLVLARQTCPQVFLALVKTDLSRHWQRISQLDRMHLDAAGLTDVRILPLSAPLRQRALRHDDRDLDRRSGYPALTAALLAELREASGRTGVLHELDDILGQLLDGVVDVRAALLASDGATGSLAEARRRADALRRRSTRWAQVLNDGIATLASDAEHDLRTRLRDVAKQVEAAIGEGDPAETWDRVRELLGERLVEQLSAHHGAVVEAAQLLAQSIGDHFAAAGAHVRVDAGAAAFAARDGVAVDAGALELSRAGIAADAMTALRGSYASVMMFGLASSLVGLAMINPLTIVAGVGLGRKAVRDERERQLAHRRAAAKQAVRRALDEVTLVEVKRTRDAVRQVHQALRDGFSARADELQRSLDAAARAADAASRVSMSERAERLAAVDGRRAQLVALREDVAKEHADAVARVPAAATAVTP